MLRPDSDALRTSVRSACAMRTDVMRKHAIESGNARALGICPAMPIATNQATANSQTMPAWAS